MAQLPERGLMPYISPPSEDSHPAFSFSVSQKKELDRAIQQQFKSLGIGVTPAALRDISAVLIQDCIPTGMAIKGRELSSLTSDEPIGRFIEEGLKQRNAIRNTAMKAFTATSPLSPSYTGRFAIPSAYTIPIKPDESNNKRFPFQADISAYTRVANLVSAREKLLPPIADIAIEQLHSAFPGITLDALAQQQADASEMHIDTAVRIVRNAIIANVFALPNPNIPSTFWDNVTPDEIRARFNTRAEFQLSSAFPPIPNRFRDPEQQREYVDLHIQFLGDLFSQTKEILLQTLRQQTDRATNQTKRETIVNTLKNLLLLTPPKAEEPIVDPWAEGNYIVLEGVRIPTAATIEGMISNVTGILQLDRRSAVTADRARLGEARSAWESYNNTYPIWTERMQRAQAQLTEYQVLSQELREGKEPDYNTVPSNLKSHSSEEISAQRNLARLQKIIQDNQPMLERVQTQLPQVLAWFDEIKAANGGEFPSSITIPTDILAVINSIGEDQRTLQRRIINGITTHAKRQLLNDFPNTIDKLVTVPTSDIQHHPGEIIKQELTRIQTVIRQSHEDSPTPYTPPTVDAIKFATHIREELDLLAPKKRINDKTSRLAKRIQLLEKTLAYVIDQQNNGMTGVSIPRDYYRQSLHKRFLSLRQLQRAKKRLTHLRSSTEIKRPLSINEIMDLPTKLKLYTITNIDGTSSMLYIRGIILQNAARDFQENETIKAVLPKMPNSITDYQHALRAKADMLTESTLGEKQTRKERRALEAQALALKQMSNALSYLPENFDLSRITPEELWKAVYSQGVYMDVLSQYTRAQEEIKDAEVAFYRERRKSYSHNLQRATTSIQEVITNLRANNPQEVFLSRMQELGLAQAA